MTSDSLSSWGLYPPHPQQPHPCHWRQDLPRTMDNLKERYTSFLPYGNGRSYGDSCLAESDQVLAMRPLNRFLQADWKSGRIAAEAGMMLDELLAAAIPRGWFLPVTPGTKYVTLGGAVANDVHGKNHHVRGTFGQYVYSLGLVRSDEDAVLTCSGRENAELLRATIGGLGLTGVIEWVEFQLIPIRSAQMDVQHTRFASLREFFAISRQSNASFEYTAAWVDCGGAKNTVGRGIFISGNHARRGGLEVNRKRKLAVPVTLPFSLINGLSSRLFNEAYYRAHAGNVSKQTGYDPFFYPLDNVLHWNRLYGRKGFQQYQCVIPDGTAEAALPELLSEIAAFGGGSPLTVLKHCGDAVSPGLLSFPLKGVSLALDFPQSEDLEQLLPRLDAIVRQSGGRLYPAKDAHMRGEDFRAFYPAWEQVEKMRDPSLCSRFWKRVTTT